MKSPPPLGFLSFFHRPCPPAWRLSPALGWLVDEDEEVLVVVEVLEALAEEELAAGFGQGALL